MKDWMPKEEEDLYKDFSKVVENLTIWGIPNKYFVPNEEDIRIGYECEVQKVIKAWTHIVDNIIRTDLEYDENWKLIIIENKYELVPYLELISTSHIRTPHLTIEQIKEEGWEVIVNAKDALFKKGCCQLELYSEEHIITMGEDLYYPTYNGYCPSINEFRYILKLLHI